MQISVIGSGYVGLVAATCLSELGHKVICVDCDSEKIAALNAGETLIHEDYLQELLSRHRGRRLSFSTSVKDATAEALVIFIAVGTPLSGNGAADLSYVESVTKAMAIISASPLGRMVANLFFGFKPPVYPVKFCATQEEAKEWIKQYLN